jgi:hypothetical protein
VSRAGRLAAIGVLLAVSLPATLAGADSFTPVVLGIKIRPVTRRHKQLPVAVSITADAGVLDTRTAPLRLQVKLAAECGGTFQYTPGTVLIDKELSPQPTTGQAYSASAKGKGKPAKFGEQTVCAWLNEEGDNRTFASDQSTFVNVSKRCTTRAARFDRSRKALKRARKHRRAHPATFRRAKHAAAKAHKRALKACGKGVPL